MINAAAVFAGTPKAVAAKPATADVLEVLL
jgi:hypothetical protein